jgi:hypothetical protein
MTVLFESWKSKWTAMSAFCFLVLTAVASGQTPVQPPWPPSPPRPGSVNYVEGQASIGTMTLTPGMQGAAVETGQTLTTGDGKAEILLTPGVFLRVGNNSSVKMVSPDLANTRVQLDKGRALVEVIEIRNQNDIRVDINGASTKLLKQGLYDFDADHAQVRVFKGKAEVTVANQTVGLGDHHDVAVMAGVKPKSQGFDEKMFEDDFYRWNSLRSGYLSEASVSAARAYVGEGGGYGPGWAGFGWYWDPYFGAFTFLPGDGIFYGGFGWGFYSPFAVYRSPFFYHPGIAHSFGAYHYPYGHGFGAPRGFAGGGFRGGGRR